MKNILENVLIESGTGVISGFFRLPPHVTFNRWDDYRFYSEFVLDEDNKTEDPEGYKEYSDKLEKLKRNLGEDAFALIKAYYANPIINLSKQDGTFL